MTSPRCFAVVGAVTIIAALGAAAPAEADTGGSASSHLVGRGDIVTSILNQVRSGIRRGSSSTPAACKWSTLTDEQLEYLVAGIARTRGDLSIPAVFAPLEARLRDSDASQEDLQVQVCDGEAVTVRAVPRPVPLDNAGQLTRQMITQLPAPAPVLSPPAGVVVPLHEPVFVSIAEVDWHELSTTLTAGDTTAEVRARPVSLRVFNGEAGEAFVPCPGRGQPYDPAASTSPETQAHDTRACVMRYSTVTSTPSRPRSVLEGTTSRPSTWLGMVTVVWSAEWRANGGPWRSLGLIPRTTMIERATREVTSAIESGPRHR